MLLHRNGEEENQPQEQSCGCHHLATEEGEGVLGNGAVVFTAPFPRSEFHFSVTVAAMVLHRDGEVEIRPQERSCGQHRLVPEEKNGVLRNGVVIFTAPFLRTGNPFSVTVPAITLHRDGEPTKGGQERGRRKGGRVPVNGQRQDRTRTVRKGFLVNRKGQRKIEQ
ncbi:hypothetical protein V501_09868 [Pseudogymnoascus sp. VKM F-4519 (FW-2642)]|nr:hypothetical protein V501_09868 [Pseudogymnoascus sp. VKM F-4519 (FW-2642)]